MVALKKLNIDEKKYPKLDLTRSMLMEFKRIKDLQHDHVTRLLHIIIVSQIVSPDNPILAYLIVL